METMCGGANGGAAHVGQRTPAQGGKQGKRRFGSKDAALEPVPSSGCAESHASAQILILS